MAAAALFLFLFLAPSEFPADVSADPGEWVIVRFNCETTDCVDVSEFRLYMQSGSENAPSKQIDACRGYERILQMRVPNQGARWFLKVRAVVDGVVGAASEEMIITRER